MTRRRVPLRIADDFVDEGLRDLVRETAGAKTLKEFQAGIDRHNRNRPAASPETLQEIRQGLAESAAGLGVDRGNFVQYADEDGLGARLAHLMDRTGRGEGDLLAEALHLGLRSLERDLVITNLDEVEDGGAVADLARAVRRASSSAFPTN